MRFFTDEIMQILASAFRDGEWQQWSKEDTQQILKCKFLYKHIQTNTSNSPRDNEAFPNKFFDLYDLAFDIFKWLLVIFDRKSLRRCELLFCDVISLFNISLVFRCHLRTKKFLPSFVPFSWFILWLRDHFVTRRGHQMSLTGYAIALHLLRCSCQPTFWHILHTTVPWLTGCQPLI